MSKKDFQQFVDAQNRRQIPSMGGGIPIIGQTGKPAQIRDKFGRVLEAGDFIHVHVDSEQFRVMQIVPAPPKPGMPPGMMLITVSQTLQFLAAKDQPDPTFIRVMTKSEQAALASDRQEVVDQDTAVVAQGGDFQEGSDVEPPAPSDVVD